MQIPIHIPSAFTFPLAAEMIIIASDNPILKINIILLQLYPCLKQSNKGNDRNIHFPPCLFPSSFITVHQTQPPQSCQPVLAIPRLLPLRQATHLCLPKLLHLQFPPSVVNHSLPLSIRSLSSTVVGRKLLSSSLLSRDSQRHPSTEPLASNKKHNTMAAAYQCQTPSQDQPHEESYIGSTTTTHPNQTNTTLFP